MQIITGLGNPGKKYERNRHNVGFEIINSIAIHNNFGPWRNKFQSKISEGTISSNKVLLVKPETFMNNSGFAIREIVSFFKLKPANLLVIHDDLDLKIGKIKIKVGGGHAGHNGLKSIDQHIGKEYLRLRIGIDRPLSKSQVSKYVLSDFSEKDKTTLNYVIKFITQDFEILANGDIEEFIKLINQNLENIDVKNTYSSVSNNNFFGNRIPTLKKLIKKFTK